MKIRCECGALILDQTDHLPNKGHIIGDKDWFDFWDQIDTAIENPEQLDGKVETAMTIRQNEPSRHIWECLQCGRLYLEDENHTLSQYVPANMKSNGILNR